MPYWLPRRGHQATRSYPPSKLFLQGHRESSDTQRLGAVLTDEQEANIILLPNSGRTVSPLSMAALIISKFADTSKSVLSEDWIKDSFQAERLLPIADFELRTESASASTRGIARGDKAISPVKVSHRTLLQNLTDRYPHVLAHAVSQR